MVICGLEFCFKTAILQQSIPLYLRVEVSPLCNLKCPGCELGGAMDGVKAISSVPKQMMYLDRFKEVISDFLPYLLKVNLYDEGEPFLNRDLMKIIRYMHDHRVSTCVSSNFSLPFNDEQIQDLLDSGLDHLIVAVDGSIRRPIPNTGTAASSTWWWKT